MGKATARIYFQKLVIRGHLNVGITIFFFLNIEQMYKKYNLDHLLTFCNGYCKIYLLWIPQGELKFSQVLMDGKSKLS